jgi:hypothetical protein
MHDGYIFTLGIAGSAGGPTAHCLDVMLAALPPVKRAAYLGDVLTSPGLPSLDDPLTAPILADVADAEVLLIVTPFLGGRLPPRLAALMRTTPPADRRRFAALVTLGAGDAAPLRMWINTANARICAELALSATGHTHPPYRRPGGASLRPGGASLRPGGASLRPGGASLRPGGASLPPPPADPANPTDQLAACARAAYAAARAVHPSALQ